MRELVLAAALLGAMLQPCMAAETVVHHGFLTGKSYLEIADVVKPLYVSGLIDGFLASPIFGAPSNGAVQRFGACVDAMSSGKATAVVTAYIRAHPQQRDWDMQVLAYDAFHEACRF